MKKTENRYRNVRITLRISDEEKEVITEKMKIVDINNMSVYLRKMALTGKCINYHFTPVVQQLKEMNYHLTMIDNNVNQIARRVNSTNTIYGEDVQYIKNEVSSIRQMCIELMKNCLPSKYGE